jgi:predicted lipoprotein with Yx(FWY)xxD motif
MMHATTLRRLLLVFTLAGGVGLAAPATAMADTAAKNSAAAADQKKKKKKKKPTIKVADSDLGEILVNGKGRTLYSFDQDSGTDETACGSGCDSTWPALESAKPKVAKGLDASLIASNSSNHVSYNGHLLYTYAADSAPGDVNGDGVGGVWHAVGADGNPLA